MRERREKEKREGPLAGGLEDDDLSQFKEDLAQMLKGMARKKRAKLERGIGLPSRMGSGMKREKN